MEINYAHRIGRMTFLLAWVAGYCDTITFVAGGNIFSAHVTGNFVVFAAQAVSGKTADGSWIKLLTFPVFIMAVMYGGWLAATNKPRSAIMLAESVTLIIAGSAWFILNRYAGFGGQSTTYFVVMTTVFALGLQNSYGKLFARDTYGPTTMMTGNVTQVSLDAVALVRKGWVKSGTSRAGFYRQSITIVGFLSGCVVGALSAVFIGLGGIMLAGLVTLGCYYQERLFPAGPALQAGGD